MRSTEHRAFPEVMDLRTLREYVSVSDKTLRGWITSPDDPLPASRIGTKLYVRRADFDRWMDRHKVDVQNLGDMVEEIVAELQ